MPLQERTRDSLQFAAMSRSVGHQMRTQGVTPESAWRKKAYHGSTAFMEALVVVQHDLSQAAAKHPSDVIALLSWVRKNGLATSSRQILKKIQSFHKDIAASLRLYIGFVLRFQVYLKFSRRGGDLKFVPDYEGPLHSQLKIGVRGGELIAPPAEPDADVRDLFAFVGGTPEEIRKAVKRKGSRILMSEQSRDADAMLMEHGLSEEEVVDLRAAQRRRGVNPEDAKLRIVEVDSEDASSVTQLLDEAYDPLSITFLLVRSRGQTRLLCLVGELVSDKEWNQLGVVRAVAHKVMRGKAPAGKRVNIQQFAQDVDRIPPDGTISKKALFAAIGGPGRGPDVSRMEKRLQRAKLRAERVRQKIAF